MKFSVNHNCSNTLGKSSKRNEMINSKTEIKKSNDLSIRLQKDEEFEKEKEDNRQESLQKAAQEVAKVTEELNEQSSKINLMENNMKIQRNLFIQQSKNNDTKVFTLYKQITEGEIQIKKQAKSIESLQNQIKQLTNNMEQLLDKNKSELR